MIMTGCCILAEIYKNKIQMQILDNVEGSESFLTDRKSFLVTKILLVLLQWIQFSPFHMLCIKEKKGASMTVTQFRLV